MLLLLNSQFIPRGWRYARPHLIAPSPTSGADDNRSGNSLLICAMHDPNNTAPGSNLALAA
jgi:hypothetical protein